MISIISNYIIIIVYLYLEKGPSDNSDSELSDGGIEDDEMATLPVLGTDDMQEARNDPSQLIEEESDALFEMTEKQIGPVKRLSKLKLHQNGITSCLIR